MEKKILALFSFFSLILFFGISGMAEDPPEERDPDIAYVANEADFKSNPKRFMITVFGNAQEYMINGKKYCFDERYSTGEAVFYYKDEEPPLVLKPVYLVSDPNNFVFKGWKIVDDLATIKRQIENAETELFKN